MLSQGGADPQRDQRRDQRRERLRGLSRRFARARSFLDFEFYRARERTSAYLGFTALVLGAVTLRWPTAAGVLGVVGGTLAVLTSAVDVRTRRERRARLRVRPAELPALTPAALPPGAELVVTAAGTAVVWPEVDQVLRTSEGPPVVWEARRYVLPPVLAEVAYDALLPTYRGGSQPRYNSSVVRQRDDLGGSGEPVRLQRAGYFDLLCSNYSVRSDVWTQGPRLLLEGQSLLLDRRGRLLGLEANRLANTVGVSTLAFTSDGCLVLVEQGRGAASSASLLAPSGSGSLEPVDVKGAGRLRDVVVRGMERELREEVNLAAGELSGTRVTGYFRWWEQGAKPEYVGVTLLTVDADTVRERPRRGVERPFVQEVLVLDRADLDLALLARDPDAALAGLDAVVQQFRQAASHPLLMALRALASSLRGDPQLAADLSP